MEHEKKWEAIIADINSTRERVKSLGQINFENFASTLQSSHVPEQFAQAANNVMDELDKYNQGSKTITREALKRLVNINYATTIEASYIISYGIAIALMKRLLEGKLNEEEQSSMKQRAEEILGTCILLGLAVTGIHQDIVRKFTRRKPSEKSLDYMKELIDQFDNRFLDPQVRAKIILLATPRRI